MAFSNKEKVSHRKSTFKSFGNFIVMHMVKRIGRRNKTSNDRNGGQTLNESEKDALEAGFDAHVHNNGYANGNQSKSVRRNNSLSVRSNAAFAVTPIKGKVINNTVNKNGVDLGSLPSMPGVFGLVNHGNTCFMNSIIQCLSNTDLLAEYFVMGHYKQDLKNCRKDRSKKYGTKGELTEQLAMVIRSLWMGSGTPDATKLLKEVIGKHASQYKGNLQHDSQEFLLWLLDKMHEDINMQPVKKKNFVRRQSFRKTKKPTIESGKLYGEKLVNAPDLSPNSFVQKVFQGHYRSSLTCPSCKKKSDTIDPYMCVSLPLKQRTTRPIYVNVVYLPNKRRSGSSRRNLAGRTIKIGVPVEIDGKINHLRQAVAGECGIHSRLLAFVDLQHDGFHESYGDDKSISDIPVVDTTNTVTNMTLYAFEMPVISKMTAGTLPRNFASKHKKRGFGSVKQKEENKSGPLQNIDSIVVILINKQGIQEQGKRFGRPLVFRTSRDVLLSELQSMVLSQMSDYLKNGVKHERMGSLFRLQIIDGLPNKSYLSQQVQQPLRLPTVDKALENSPAGGPLHIKLVAEWDTDVKAGIFEKFPEEKVEVQDSVRLQRILHQQPVTCTLEECFDLNMQEEELSPEDSWLCPHCNKQQHGTVKKLSLYTLPDIFILHLKRFQVADGHRTKLTTRVEYPVTGLDMSKHLHKSDPQSPLQPPADYGSRWNHSNTIHANKMHRNPDDNLFDLYAVCNHYGNMNSGHYTACCNNPLDGRWYLFDDNQTECVGEDSLSSQSVYILFYQRRSSSAALSCGGASINSVMSDHWAYNLPQFKQRAEFNSQRHLNQHSVAPVARKKVLSSPRAKVEAPDESNRANMDNALAMQININNNSTKIAAAAKELREEKKKKKKEDAAQEDSDDGGFDSPTRPYARGLRRQGSAIVGKPRRDESGDRLRGRQYRSYRHNRPTRRQQSSHV